MSGGITTLAGGLRSTREATASSSANMNQRFVAGSKNHRPIFSAQITGQGASAFVNTSTRQIIHQQGNLDSTELKTNVALNGQGMIPVASRANGDISFTRDGSFYINHEGILVNDQGYQLMAWRLEGNALPGEAGNPNNAPAGDLGSLERVRTADFHGKAEATKKIELGLRLDSGTKKLTGAGQLFRPSSVSSSSALDTLIVPDQTALGSIKIGDELRVLGNASENTETLLQNSVKFVYGGISSSRHITQNIFGRTTTSQIFEVSTNAANPGSSAFPGHGISLKLGESSFYSLTFKPTGQPIIRNGEFNSLSTLSDALNSLDGISARIHNGRLYVGPTDGTSSLTFTNTSSTNFKGIIGFEDIDKAPEGEKRITTLKALQSFLNDNTSYSSSIGPNGGLNINVESAENNIMFDANASRIFSVKHAYVNQPSYTTAGSGRNGREVRIEAKDHGLKPGDFVKLSGAANINNAGVFAGGAETLNGLYYVTATNEDGFTVASGARIDPAFVTAANTQILAPNTELKWQKYFGEKAGEVKQITGVTTGVYIYNGVAVPRPAITLTSSVANALQDFAQDDVVYLSGIGNIVSGTQVVTISDGYYRIDAQTPTSISIVPTNSFTIVVPPAPFDSTVNLPGGTNVPTGFSIRKILSGQAAADGDHNINIALTRSLERVQGGGGDAPGKYRVHMPSHGLKEGDYIRFRDFDDNIPQGLDLADTDNGLYETSAKRSKLFRVESVDPLGNYFEISIKSTQPFDDVAPANNYITLTALGADFKIDFLGSFLSEIGFIQNKIKFDPTYNALGGDAGNNLSGGKIRDGIWQQTISVYDSLGNKNDFRIAFAKLSNKEWAVELYNVRDSNGQFSVDFDGMDAERKNDGMLASGKIEFDGRGNIIDNNSSIFREIKITWLNGAEQNNITLDFGLQGNGENRGVHQVRGTNDVYYINQDGHSAGDLSDITIDQEGKIIAHFSNGKTKPMFQIPVAMFADIDSLTQISGSNFQQNMNSGAVILRKSGVSGAAMFASSVIEGSTTDETMEISDNIIKYEQHFKMVMAALRRVIDMESSVANNL